MTQHSSSPTDQQHPTEHPSHVTNTPVEPNASRGFSGWWFGLLALLPIACCALPLLVVGGVAAGSGAVLGGVTGGVLLLTGAAVLGIWGMRRRSRTRTADSSTTAPPSRDRCC
ncbi:phage holin family protein [Nocardioides sp. HDW12B]|uniref:phage holin family protein n=1 Tax=Nocardioides sp. HDW12B TaxID=2714939 RepID=UPI00140B84A3|nr:phage holin family protein [Nocardioides sp. HDW12B]QIK66407.1 phage holin family protein [Nocardioides sp. HDW12B]